MKVGEIRSRIDRLRDIPSDTMSKGQVLELLDSILICMDEIESELTSEIKSVDDRVDRIHQQNYMDCD